MTNFALILSGIVAVLLIVAAVVDWQRREIPDWVNLGIALLAVPHWWALQLTVWPGLALQAAVVLGAFVVFAGVWALKQMGGGDVKLIVALALFLTPLDFAHMLFVMGLAGGVLTVVMAVEHRLRKRAAAFENPYGIAIAFAGLWVIAERYLNHLG